MFYAVQNVLVLRQINENMKKCALQKENNIFKLKKPSQKKFESRKSSDKKNLFTFCIRTIWDSTVTSQK